MGSGTTDEEEFMRVWPGVWGQATGNTVVVMGMPRESVVWQMKKR